MIHGDKLSKIDSLKQSTKVLIYRLTELNDYARTYNIELLYENQIPDKSRRTHVYPTSLGEWVDTLKKTNTKAWLDLGHLAVHGESFKTRVSTLCQLLKAVNI